MPTGDRPNILPRTASVADDSFLADTPRTRRRVARALNLVLLGVALLALLLHFTMPGDGARLLTALGAAGVVATARWQLGRGPRAALVTLWAGFWLLTTVSMTLFGGVHAALTILYPLLTVLAGWTLGSRWAYTTAGASIGVCIAFGSAQHLKLYASSASGNPLLVAAIHSAVLLASAGVVAFVLGSFQRQRLEAIQLSEELAEQFLRVAQREHELDMVIDNAPAMIAAADENFRYRYVNRSYAEFIGRAPADLVGKYVPDILTDASPQTLQHLRDAIDKGVRSSYRREFTSAHSGKSGVVAIDVVPYHDVEGKPASLALVRDITEQAQAEAAVRELNESLERRVAERTAELEQAYDTLKRSQAELSRADRMAALGTLVAGLSHELGTPIGNSVMTASLLGDQSQKLLQAIEQNTIKRTQLADFLVQLQQGSDLLLRNLQRAEELLINFKQVAVDQTSESRRRFDLRTTAEEILDTLTPTLKHKPQKVLLDIPPGLQFDSYPGPLGQVLINLINNAFLHAFEGRDDGILRIAASAADADRVCLTVTDDGCGIPATVMPHLFEPFFTTKAGAGGTGLGLNIVYNIVTDLLGGDIDVSSPPGKGTTFSLTLPLVAPAPASPQT